MKSIGIILAGGIGSRFGADRPKQYCKILGKEMISYSIDAFRNAESIDDFIVVLDKEQFEKGEIKDRYGVKTVLGGSSRNESFKNALDYIATHYPDCEKIIENNAACPMITSDVLDKYIGLLDEYDYVETAFKITDALGAYDKRDCDREDFYLIQAPDAYRFKLLYKYFDENSTLCHPAQQLPKETRGYQYFDYGANHKVTYPYDLEIVEILLKNKK
ncbi:MAG: 2-C-methyl-D-erythritol 4-phosphate cytidylyltransferase [Clostridia bacterium]|nr:2-C-methyl-D-erythritol 4-phosphate cytidylyltransferase [Clostridia bacterium]